MPAHRQPRPLGVAGNNGVGDRRVLALEGFEIGALSLGAMRGDADALPRDDEAAEIFEEMRDILGGILGGVFTAVEAGAVACVYALS